MHPSHHRYYRNSGARKKSAAQGPYLSIEANDYNKDGFALEITNISDLPIQEAKLYLQWMVHFHGESTKNRLFGSWYVCPSFSVDCSEVALRKVHTVSLRCEVIRFDRKTVETEIKITIEWRHHDRTLRSVRVVEELGDDWGKNWEELGDNLYVRKHQGLQRCQQHPRKQSRQINFRDYWQQSLHSLK